MPNVPQQPTEQSASGTKGARVFTMPPQYRHGKEVKMVEPKKEQKSAPIPMPPPIQPKPPIAPARHSVKTHTSKALIMAGVVVLFALGIAGYLVFRSAQKQTMPESPVISSQPATPAPRPVEIKEQEPTAQTEPAQETESPFAKEVQPGKDSDSDGITDLEENLVYKTNPSLPDTDADGFLDGNEVFHRYNPNGTAPGTLVEAGLVKLLSFGKVQMSYPSVWQADETENGFTLKTTTGESILLMLLPNPQPLAWIETQGGQERVVKTKSKSGFDLYLTQDKQKALLLFGETAFEFTYGVASKSTLDYLQTFHMMINSVEARPGV